MNTIYTLGIVAGYTVAFWALWILWPHAMLTVL